MLRADLPALIEAHVFAAERLHGDDTTVPVLAKRQNRHRAIMGLCARRSAIWRSGTAGGGVLLLARSRRGASRRRIWPTIAGILQADAYGGYDKLYEPGRNPGPITEAACWAHARRKFFVLADLAANAQRKAQGKTPAFVSPLALAAVRRIDALFDIERDINGKSAADRLACRREFSAPLVAESGDLDAAGTRQALAPQRRRQGDGLHAQALGRRLPASSTTDGSA